MQQARLKPKNIDEYISLAAVEVQPLLWQLHECIIKAAPNAVESLKWSMPAYSYERILVTFAVFKNHIGFYPTPSVVKAFEKELSAYKTAESSVQFSLKEKLPLILISKMIKLRVKESKTSDAKWKG